MVPSVVAGSLDGAPQVLPAAVAGSNLTVGTSGGASSLIPDCPAVEPLHVVAPPSAIDPVELASASSFESWVKLGFDLEVADVLTCVGAFLSSLCTTPGRNNFTRVYLNDVSFTCTSERPPTRIATSVGADGLRCVPWHCCCVRQHARQHARRHLCHHRHAAFTHRAAVAQCTRCDSFSTTFSTIATTDAAALASVA